MREVKITCDMCGLSIMPLDQEYIGSGSLTALHYSSQLGHNQVPGDGWHFHYSCFSRLVPVMLKTMESAKNGKES